MARRIRFPPLVRSLLAPRHHADDEQPALAEPLLEVGGGRGRIRGRGRRRPGRDVGERGRLARGLGGRQRPLRGGAGAGGLRGDQPPDQLLEHGDASLQPLDRFPLLVGHCAPGPRRAPMSVIPAVAAAMMIRSHRHPGSTAGTSSCARFMAKSKPPTNKPSSAVPCSVKPSRTSRPPVARMTAAWPAAIAAVTPMPPARVCMNSVRDGTSLKNEVWITDITTPAAAAQMVAHAA